MKPKFIILGVLCALVVDCPAQLGMQRNLPGDSGPGRYDAIAAQQRRDMERRKAQEARDKAEREAINNFVPDDPWREIGGVTNYARGAGWVQFGGQVLQVVEDGIRVRGYYGPPPQRFDRTAEREFIVVDFPYTVAEDEWIGLGMSFVAQQGGTYKYTTVQGAARSIRKLEYGRRCNPPPEIVRQHNEIVAKQRIIQAEQEQKRKEEAAAAKLKFHQELADKGDAYGQCQMGLRYLDGKGVEQNRSNAVYYFTMAAAQTNNEAMAALQEINKISSSKP